MKLLVDTTPINNSKSKVLHILSSVHSEVGNIIVSFEVGEDNLKELLKTVTTSTMDKIEDCNDAFITIFG